MSYTRAFLEWHAHADYTSAVRLGLIIGLYLLALLIERIWDHFDTIIPRD